jgi:hypothetical protein
MPDDPRCCCEACLRRRVVGDTERGGTLKATGERFSERGRDPARCLVCDDRLAMHPLGTRNPCRA